MQISLISVVLCKDFTYEVICVQITQPNAKENKTKHSKKKIEIYVDTPIYVLERKLW